MPRDDSSWPRQRWYGAPHSGHPVARRGIGDGYKWSYSAGGVVAAGAVVVKVFSSDVVWPLALLTTMTYL